MLRARAQILSTDLRVDEQHKMMHFRAIFDFVPIGNDADFSAM
jgi:hypothetical protein